MQVTNEMVYAMLNSLDGIAQLSFEEASAALSSALLKGPQTEMPEDVMKAAKELFDVAYHAEDDEERVAIIARAIMAERERSQWQPIETAPQDGTGILAYNPLMGVYNTAYQKNEPDERDRWPCGFSGFLGWWYCWPTHWMPLPAHPKQEA